MHYLQQSLDFSLQAVPISSGRLSALEHYSTRSKVGELSVHLVNRLIRIPFVKESSLTFSLVNVTNTRSNVSSGVCNTPSEEVWTRMSNWLFTFALTADRYDQASVIEYSSVRGLNTYLWATEHGRPMYVTVGLTATEALQFGLGTDARLVDHLYFTVGMVTKAIVLNKKFEYTEEPFSDYHKHLYLGILASSMQLQPIQEVMTNRPYHLWVFNRSIWTSFPALLCPQHITPKSALYFLMYLGRVDRLFGRHYIPLFSAMLALFKQGAERVGVVSEPEDIDLVYAALHVDEFDYAKPVQQLDDVWRTLSAPADVDSYVEQLFFR